MVQIENLKKRFGQIVAVDGITLEVRPGEAFGLLGPNGAGKSTTIGMMVGLITPDSGTVTIDNTSPTHPATRFKIGVAPQSLSLYEELSAAENLAFFGSIYGIGGKRLNERVKWALDFAGLTDRASGMVKTFSGGMKRRLNLACALVHEPRLIVLDEPTVGVDPQSRNHLLECIERLRGEGLTVLYTTHYMGEVERLCDRVGIVDHGRLLDVDTVSGLLARHGGGSLVTGQLQRPVEPGTLGGEINGLEWQLQTDEPMAALSAAARAGVEFNTLNIRQPDLESVFLKMTGRTLRD